MSKTPSETATVIITNAAGRESLHVLPLPALRAPAPIIRKTITKLVSDGLLEMIPAARGDEIWSETDEGDRTTLRVNGAGLAAVGIEDEAPVSRPGAQRAPTRRKASRRATKPAAKAASGRTRERGGKTSKQDEVIRLLRRGNGASVEEMMAATGWQEHSVRGFMSGALKKRLGLEVISEKDAVSGERRYFVAPLRSNGD